jgi:hypothetical protein
MADGMVEWQAEWLNGGNGYLLSYGTIHADDNTQGWWLGGMFCCDVVAVEFFQ